MIFIIICQEPICEHTIDARELRIVQPKLLECKQCQGNCSHKELCLFKHRSLGGIRAIDDPYLVSISKDIVFITVQTNNLGRTP